MKTNLEILEHIIQPDSWMEWTTKPFNAFGKTMSTNTFAMFISPEIGYYENREGRILNIYPLEPNMDVAIPLSVLKEAFDMIPKKDIPEMIIVKCDACDGEGEVEYEFEYKMRTYQTEATCPLCDGEGGTQTPTGKPSGKVEYDLYKLVQVGECAYNASRLSEIIWVAEAKEVDHVRLIHQTTPLKASIFLIDDIEVLSMPSRPDNNTETIHTIKA